MKYNQTRSENIKKAVSIIIPVINEQRTIKQLIEDIFSAFSNKKDYVFEVIIIDDHSTDSTPRIINQLKRKFQLRYFLKQGKKGKAYSLLEGFAHARYNMLAMIDADLQYPPSAIPEMAERINSETGVVIAKRKFGDIHILRKILSHGFSRFFAQVLHGLKYDVQSGLKVFKREIFERITVDPGPWSFDLEFLIKAKQAGYGIEEYEIDFRKRDDQAKISLLSASFEIGLSAIKLFFLNPDVIPIHHKKADGKGFHYKGVEFIHHSNLPNIDSAFKTLYLHQKVVLLSLAAVLITGLLLNWIITLTILISLLTVIYFIDLVLNLFLAIRGFTKKPEIHITTSEIKSLQNEALPKYTILCPLYREWDVLPQFITAMSSIDYPKNKLQVMLLLEEDDKETIENARNYDLPDYFEVVVVPHSLPKTKPKALNYGLQKTKGEYVVIYDAEDIPDPLQLKKVLLAFAKASDKTVCIQAKLNFYNPHQNLLTKIFTAEYSLWFDMVLTGLQSVLAPIPLGGTSNHFKTADIKKLNGWDSFNVTEDADLGMRLVKHGYQTALINSDTMEEANSDVLNWFEQRTRWIKGYIQTYLVHMRNPRQFIRNTSIYKMFIFQIFVGGKVLFMFFNPLMWLTTILYFAFRPVLGVFIEQFFPGPILYLGVFCLVFGNFLYMYYYMVGCVKRGHPDLVKYVYFIPIYWIFMSIAAWKAVVQLIQKPHFWPKTIHGLHLDSRKIEKKLIDTQYAAFPSGFVPSFVKAKKANLLETWSNKTLRSGGFLLTSIMVSNFLNFLFNAYLGRAVSFSDFGLITLVNTLWYLISIFVTALSATINHRYAYLQAKDGVEASNNFFLKTFKKSIVFSMVVAVIWIILTPTLTGFFNLGSIIPMLSFVVVILLAPIVSANSGLLHGSFSFYLAGILIVVAAITKFISSYIFVALNLPNLAYLSIPLAISFSFIVASLSIYYKMRKVKESNAFKYYFPKRFFIGSVISGFATNAFLTFDVILTKHFLPSQQAGEYAFLSLIGKMIFFFGSILSTFIIPFVSRDLGSNRDPNKSFYRILLSTTVLTSIMFAVIGIFGKYLIPQVFGAKTYPILPYIQLYSLAIAMYVITSTIVNYHLARYHYVFPATALILALLMSLGLVIFHGSIAEVVMVVLIVSVISLDTMLLLHLLQKNGKFFIKNLVDLLGLFVPLPKNRSEKVTGKRILIFNWRDTKHTYAGGAETYIYELAKRWVKSGNQVTLFCGNDGNCLRDEVMEGIQIYRRGGFYFVYVWALFYYLFKFRGQFDVIIDSENGIPFFTPLYADEKKFLLIHHVHQEVFRKSLKPPFSWIAEAMELKLMPFVYKKIQTITVSPSSKKEIIEKQLSDVEPIIVYNGVDLEKYKPAQKNYTPTVLYLGRLKYYKSLHIFIRSAKKILEKIPKVRFIIAGDGEEKNNLIKFTNKMGLGGMIEFVGKVSEEEKIDLYQKAWVFVNPSFMEGWGITSIEANACGTPVVASNVPGLRDSVKNPHSGFLVPYGSVNEFSNKVTLLITDYKLRTELSQGAIEWAKNFDWQKSADKSLQFISDEK